MSLPPTEAAEVREALEGNRSTFEAVVERAYPFIYRYVLGRVGAPSTAEDITQETFLVVARDLARLRKPARFWSWTFGIASRQTGVWLRRQRRSSRALDELRSREAVEAGGEDPADPLQRREETRILRSILERLPRKQADAIRLRHLENLSYDEVAAVLGVPRKTVDTWLLRGLRRLRQHYARSWLSRRRPPEETP